MMCFDIRFVVLYVILLFRACDRVHIIFMHLCAWLVWGSRGSSEFKNNFRVFWLVSGFASTADLVFAKVFSHLQ